MEWWRVGLALVMPWLAGALAVRALWRDAPAGTWPLAMGYGGLLGLLAVTLLLRAQAALGAPPNFIGVIVVLAALTLLSGWWMWWRTSTASVVLGAGRSVSRTEATWAKALFGLVLVWLGVRLVNLTLEVWWRPLYPWDAWSTWMVRPRVWAEMGQWLPFADGQRWLADATGAVYTIDAWNYPYTVSLVALWPALAYGAWNETAANLPWLGCGLALGLGFYGQARLWGASALTSLLFTWLLLSLPLLNTHVALAGYADAWLAAAFGLAVIAFMQWLRTGDPRQGLLALLCAGWCPLLKLEGAVWLVLFIPAVLVARLRVRSLLALTGGAMVLAMGWWLIGGIHVVLPGLGDVRLTPQLIQMPYLGRFELGYRGSWDPVVKNFLVLANWHLFGYLALAAVIMATVELRRRFERWLLAGLVFVAVSLLALFVLFFLTDAQRWAEQYTSINRVFLDFVPALLFWTLTVFQRIPSASLMEKPGNDRSNGGEHAPV